MTSEDQRNKAIEAASTWARRFSVRPWRLRELVTGVESTGATYARAITRWTTKAPVWRQRPHQGRRRISEPAVGPEEIDPWSVDDRKLADDSLHILSCPTCDGSKKVDCGACGGSARVSCVHCGGRGRVTSKSSNRMINCRRCRGDGQAKCPVCRSGHIPCPPCGAKGKLEAWLELETRQQALVGVWPHGPHQQTHPGINEDNAVADAWDGAVVVENVEAGQRLEGGHVGAFAQDLGWSIQRTSVEPALDGRCDRVTYQSVRVYQTPITNVSFAFGGRVGALQLLGSHMTPTEVFNAAPFLSYRWSVTAAAATSALAVLLGCVIYLSRDPFYAATAGMCALFLLVAGLGATAFVAAWRRRAGSPLPTRKLGLVGIAGAVLLAAGAIGTAALVHQGGPSAVAALEASAAGDSQRAEQHLLAIDRLGQSSPESEAAWISMHRRVAEDAESDEGVLEVLPGQADRFGDAPDIARLRIAARMRLLERALAQLDFEAAQIAVAALRAENDERDSALRVELRKMLLATARKLLESDQPKPAERTIALAWDELRLDPDAVELGENAVLAQVDSTGDLVDKIALLRRAEALNASTGPAERIGALYDEAIKTFPSAPTKGDDIAALVVHVDRFKRVRALFPERGEEVDEKAAPFERELQRQRDKARAREEAEKIKADRKRAGAERQARREAKRSAAKRQAARKEKRSTTPSAPRPVSQPVARTCCKYCSTGKPCGNSCISRNKTCHKGRGCAC